MNVWCSQDSRIASVWRRKPLLCTLQLVFLMTTMLVAARPVCAQTADGAITGTVKDPAGEVIPGATLDLTDIATHVELHTVTNRDGVYRFSQVAPGHYQLTVHKESFGAVSTALEVTVAQTVQFDAALALGQVSEEVTVSEGSLALDTQSPTVGSVVEQKQIEDLPMNGQNPFALANLDPGISSFSGFGGGISSGREALLAAGSNNFQSNGGITGHNELLLDGIPDTVCCQGQPALLPTSDIVQQFRVQTGVPPANFGRSSGAVMNFVTKTGASRMHGDLFEYSGNTIFNAAQWFTKHAGKPPIMGRSDYRLPFNFNQFGGTVSGPMNLPKQLLGHDRVFFFFGFESAQAANASNSIVTVPTPLQRQGNFTEAPSAIYDPSTETQNGVLYTRKAFPNNTIPTNRLNGVALAYLALMPLPNLPGTVNNLSTISKSYDNDWQFSLRFDAHFTPKLFSFLRITDSTAYDARSGATSPLFSDINAQYQRIRSAVIAMGNTYTFNPQTLLEFHYGFSWQRNLNPGSALNYDPAAYGFSPAFVALQQIRALPTQSVSGYASFGAQGGTLKDSYTHAIGASIITQIGRHALTYGYDGRLFLNMLGTNANPGGTFSYSTTFTNGPNTNSTVPSGQSPFDSFASFLLGLPTSGNITQTDTFAQEQPYEGFYIQDDWRWMPWLTINAGLRYDIESGANERHNKFSQLDPNLTNPLAAATGLNFTGGLVYSGVNGHPRGTWKTDYIEFGPRFGVELSPDTSTVFRAGYGLLFLPTTQRLQNGGNPAYSVTTAFLATINGHTPVGNITNPFPTGVLYSQGASAGPAGLTGSAITSYDYNDDPPYVQQYEVGVEKTIQQTGIFHLNYVGSHGVKLPISLFPNNLNPEYFGTPGDSAQVAYLQTAVANPFRPYVSSGTLAASTVARQQLLARYPQYTSVGLQYFPGGSNTYNSLQASVTEKFHALTATVAYTWSKQLGIANNDLTSALDTGSPGYQNSYLLKEERSLNVTDTPQRLVGSAIYQLPFGRGQRFGGQGPTWVDQVIGGWTISTIVTAQSGLPLPLTVSGAPAFAGTRPNFVRGAKVGTTGSAKTRIGGTGTQPYLNSSAFTVPVSFQMGNVPRLYGGVRSPGVMNVDASGRKRFKLTDTFSLQFTGQAFNLFNRTQFGRPATAFNAAGFGAITSQANSPRQIQLGIQLLF